MDHGIVKIILMFFFSVFYSLIYQTIYTAFVYNRTPQLLSTFMVDCPLFFASVQVSFFESLSLKIKTQN